MTSYCFVGLQCDGLILCEIKIFNSLYSIKFLLSYLKFQDIFPDDILTNEKQYRVTPNEMKIQNKFDLFFILRRNQVSTKSANLHNLPLTGGFRTPLEGISKLPRIQFLSPKSDPTYNRQ